MNFFLKLPNILCNFTTEQEHTDQIRDCHQRIGNIRETPYQIQCLCTSEIHNKGKNKAVYHIKPVRSQQIFKCFFSVILPAEYCRKRKQCNPDCHKPAPGRSQNRLKCRNCNIRTGQHIPIFISPALKCGNHPCNRIIVVDDLLHFPVQYFLFYFRSYFTGLKTFAQRTKTECIDLIKANRIISFHLHIGRRCKCT